MYLDSRERALFVYGGRQSDVEFEVRGQLRWVEWGRAPGQPDVVEDSREDAWVAGWIAVKAIVSTRR